MAPPARFIEAEPLRYISPNRSAVLHQAERRGAKVEVIGTRKVSVPLQQCHDMVVNVMAPSICQKQQHHNVTLVQVCRALTGAAPRFPPRAATAQSSEA